MIVRLLSELAESEFAERACTWQGEFPQENVEPLADRGLIGINLAEEYGGGMGKFEAVLAIETVGRVCSDTANYLYGQSMVAPRAVEMFGTEAAKERYLPPVTAGESALAIAISEPAAGSDVGAMRTRIEESGGDYYLSGKKI
jgi:alkylation response protein AidB-like acyl-CoA dehydrogenase